MIARLAIPMLAVGVLAAGCGSDSAGTGKPVTTLSISYDADGSKGGGAPQHFELTCPSQKQAEACAVAAQLTIEDFKPVPAGQACTMIYGGDQTVAIKGDLRGTPVDRTFTRADGCEIEAYDKVATPLLKSLGVAVP